MINNYCKTTIEIIIFYIYLRMERELNIYDYLGEKTIRKKGIIKERVIQEDIDIGEHLSEYRCFGVLFSAHWCPPCRGLLMNLKTFYNEINAKRYIKN